MTFDAMTRWKRQRQQSKREKLRDVINAVVRKVKEGRDKDWG